MSASPIALTVVVRDCMTRELERVHGLARELADAVETVFTFDPEEFDDELA